MKIKQTLLLLAAALCMAACSEKDDAPDTPPTPPEEEKPTPVEPVVKEKMLWCDFESNIPKNFATRESITANLEKAKEVGFNKIVVDVKSVSGYLTYKKATVLPIDPAVRNNDWDYLQYFLDEAHRLGLKVTVSTTVFPMGIPSKQTGPIYDEPAKWAGRTCLQYTKNGMLDIKDDPTKVAAFLNPVMEENQQLALNFIKEIVRNYEFDAYALDYCRFCDAESDFSDTSRAAFEKYINKHVENWPTDIFSYNADGVRVAGIYYKQWWEFRSQVITDFIGRVKQEIKAIKPDIKLEYWAASWWAALFQTGQNWASKSFVPLSDRDAAENYYAAWCSDTYGRTGFAEHLDTFLLGAYLDVVRPASNKASVAYAILFANRLIKNQCTIYGTVECSKPDFDIEDACYLCLKETPGLMVFDIVHVIHNNKWEAIRRGIEKAEKELAAGK